MTLRPTLLAAGALLVASGSLRAQPGDRLMTLDLATPLVSRTVDPGTYHIVLKNRLPGQEYTVSVLRETIPVQPLDSLIGRGQLPWRAAEEDCGAALQRLRLALDTVSFETGLARVLGNWEDGQKKHGNECVEDGRILFERATRQDIPEAYALNAHQQLRITVSRANTTGTTTRWEFVASTEARGEWRTIYGLTFVPDRDQRFYARQLDGTPTRFVVTRERDNAEGLATKFLPSVLFVWAPARNRNYDWSPGLTGGVGYNFDRLAVLLGGALTYNENLTLTAGAAIHQQQRLLGQYTKGDTIASNLTPAQLHVDRYLPNVYFGIALRLGSNPFSRSAEQPAPVGSRPAESPENAARKDSTPASRAPGGSNTNVIDADALKDGTPITVAEREATVAMTADSIIVTFPADKDFANVVGTYVASGETHGVCLDPDTDVLEALPHVKDAPAKRICLDADAAGKLAGSTPGTVIEATLSRLRIAISKQDHAIASYTATLKEAHPN